MPITDPISRTARLTAAARARESRRADRLFDDPLAEALAGPEGFAFMERFEAAARPAGLPGAGDNPYIAIRSRFFDEFVTAAFAGPGAPRQTVLLAAGLDTRAFRLDWPARTKLYELDRPELLDAKQEILDRAGARPRCQRTSVPVDLTKPWAPALRAAGFDPGAPSVWLVEGLTPYLDAPSVRRLLEESASLATPGSRLGIDLIGESFLRSPYVRAAIEAMAREGSPWQYGTDDPEGLLAAAGWKAAVLRAGDPGASYGRWPFMVFPRGTPNAPESFLVTATRG
jgi:methyltransferase (TIGR00027 family)